MNNLQILNPVQAFKKQYEQKAKTLIEVDTFSFDTFFEIEQNDKSQKIELSAPEQLNLFSGNNPNFNLLKLPFCELKQIAINHLETIRPLKISSKSIESFVGYIFAEYNFVPYHNFCHGFSVMQTFYSIVNKCVLFQKLFDRNHIFVGCIAGLSHDAGHFGKNNAFCTGKKNKLALKAFNKSVLEKFHIKKTLYVLQKPESDLFSEFSEQENWQFRQTIIESILGTDMVKHNELLKRFNDTKREDFQTNDNFLTAFLIHCGDLANMCLPYERYLDWVKLLAQEFNCQTISEQKNHLKVSQFMVFNGFGNILDDQLFFGSQIIRHVCAAFVCYD